METFELEPNWEVVFGTPEGHQGVSRCFLPGANQAEAEKFFKSRSPRLEILHMSPILKPKPLIYIASPYTKGDPAINVRFQHDVFDVLLSDGRCLPYAPLAVSHYQHIVHPRPYEDWIKFDLDLIPYMDACLRLNANAIVGELTYHESRSAGADGEVAEFRKQGKPVFYSIAELYKWL